MIRLSRFAPTMIALSLFLGGCCQSCTCQYPPVWAGTWNIPAATVTAEGSCANQTTQLSAFPGMQIGWDGTVQFLSDGGVLCGTSATTSSAQLALTPFSCELDGFEITGGTLLVSPFPATAPQILMELTGTTATGCPMEFEGAADLEQAASPNCTCSDPDGGDDDGGND